MSAELAAAAGYIVRLQHVVQQRGLGTGLATCACGVLGCPGQDSLIESCSLESCSTSASRLLENHGCCMMPKAWLGGLRESQ